MVKKYTKDGNTAVLVHHGCGGTGWSTSNVLREELLIFEPTIVGMILEDKSVEEIEEYVSSKYPTVNRRGISGLEVTWVTSGIQFMIEEKNGYETVITPRLIYTS